MSVAISWKKSIDSYFFNNDDIYDFKIDVEDVIKYEYKQDDNETRILLMTVDGQYIALKCPYIDNPFHNKDKEKDIPRLGSRKLLEDI